MLEVAEVAFETYIFLVNLLFLARLVFTCFLFIKNEKTLQLQVYIQQ